MSSFFSCFQWINWAYDCKLLPSKRYDLFLSWKTTKEKNCLQRHLLTTWIPGILFSAYNLKSKLQVQFIAWCAFFSSFEQKSLDEQYFDAVDLVETAFNKLADNVVSVLFYVKCNSGNRWDFEWKEFLVIPGMVTAVAVCLWE